MGRKQRVAWVLAAVLQAGAAGALVGEITLPKAKRGEVVFTHRAHIQDYGIRCQRCHHTTSVTPGATACEDCHLNQQHKGLCRACHLSEKDPDFEASVAALRQKLGKDRIPNGYRAFHTLCRDCHAAENKARGRKAPYECGGCHNNPR